MAVTVDHLMPNDWSDREYDMHFFELVFEFDLDP